MSMVKDFKAFVLRGNVMDMAVGVIIGGAFGKIVTSLVNDILMPPLGKLIGNVDFKDLFVSMNGKAYASLDEATRAGAPIIRVGVFLNQIFDFLIVAAVVFLVVNRVGALMESRMGSTPPPPETKECPECAETVLAKARKCKFCGSTL
ncbi:MAG TPA: large conductance mechanosensitive channel protein MscL [bacterium]|nr:large conductance mechanosensitive channel protein MscL [bacterium]HXC63930.1 large conductance mechanosensitive channel protein MscL [bacterium]